MKQHLASHSPSLGPCRGGHTLLPQNAKACAGEQRKSPSIPRDLKPYWAVRRHAIARQSLSGPGILRPG